MKNKFNKTNKKILKSKEVYSLAKNIFVLTLNALAFGGIMTAIGLDKLTDAPAEAVLTTAGISLAVGVVGVCSALALERQEAKQEKLIKEQTERQKDSLEEQGYTFETGM